MIKLRIKYEPLKLTFCVFFSMSIIQLTYSNIVSKNSLAFQARQDVNDTTSNIEKTTEYHIQSESIDKLDTTHFPGYFPAYPFKGIFSEQPEDAPFNGNIITTHEIYIDDNAEEHIASIRKKWKALPLSNITNTKHLPNKVYWIKAQFKGSSYFNGEQLLHISSTIGNDQFSFDDVDVYIDRHNDKLEYQKTGDHVSLGERPSFFWANFIKLNIAQDEKLDVYIRASGADPRFLMSQIALFHIDPSSVYPKQVYEGVLYGVFSGILGIQCIFFFFLAITERERIHMYFTLMAVGFFLITCFDDNNFSRFILFPSLRDYFVPLFYLGLFLSLLGFLKFTITYFNYSIQGVINKRIIPLFLIASAALLTNSYTRLQFTGGENGFSSWHHVLSLLSVVTGIIMVLVMAAVAPRQNNVSKRIFFIAFIPLSITAILAMSRSFLSVVFDANLIENQLLWAMGQDNVKISIITMLTILAVSIGYRTNRLKEEKKLADGLAEKNKIIEAKSKQNETLLKEIHHRVKNNLQTISSLLYLQSYGEKNDKTKENIAITQQRVESMALIHKNLYQRDNLAAIEMKDYIKNLCESLISAYQTPSKKVALVMDMPTFELDIDRAIPMGLIINEIVTNSMKYAFPKVYNGNLNISLKTSPNHEHSILIADNGIGKANDSVPSFGSKLIQLLTKQINASMTSGNDNGHWVRITWFDDEEDS